MQNISTSWSASTSAGRMARERNSAFKFMLWVYNYVRGNPAMSRSFLCCVCFCITAATDSFAQTPLPPARTTTKQSAPKVEKAQWTKDTGDLLGISQDDFVSMGLPKLTKDEFIKLVTWAGSREYGAREQGKAQGRQEQKASELVLQTFSCGPILDETNVTKVHVLIDENNQNSSTIMSELRQTLRSISDVQIVYAPQDADVELGVLSFEVRQGNPNQLTGYAVSVVVGVPCKAKLGTSEWDFKTSDDHILQTGGIDPRRSVSSVVASLDSDFEGIRKAHAEYLKFLKEQKKAAGNTN